MGSRKQCYVQGSAVAVPFILSLYSLGCYSRYLITLYFYTGVQNVNSVRCERRSRKRKTGREPVCGSDRAELIEVVLR